MQTGTVGEDSCNAAHWYCLLRLVETRYSFIATCWLFVYLEYMFQSERSEELL